MNITAMYNRLTSNIYPRICMVAVAAICIGYGSYRFQKMIGTASIDQSSSRKAVNAARDIPLRFEPCVEQPVEISETGAIWLRGFVHSPTNDDKPNLSHLLHFLRLYGRESRFFSSKLRANESALKMITDNRVGLGYFGSPNIIRTRSGIRFTTNKHQLSSEIHRDQVLATLAEVSVPLSTQLMVDDSAYTLRDVLADSIANFNLDQEELAWTALAYALYLPPVREWTNRYGDHYNFDALVGRLIDEPLEKASCGGIHVLLSLVAIARIDREIPILSDITRIKLWNFLNLCLNTIVSAQKPDGSWTVFWNQALRVHTNGMVHTATDSPKSQLLITGHLTELLTVFPSQIRYNEQILIESSKWLIQHLQSMRQEELNRQFCPVGHAVIALKRTTGRAGPTQLPEIVSTKP